MRPVRYLVRTPLLLAHIVVGLPLTVVALNPLLGKIPVGKRRLDQFMISWWSGTLIRVFGFRIRSFGTPLPGAVMYVANHLSWLDIELMHSQRAIGFVAKSEIASWPLVGWLATRAGTIYHRRGDSDSMAAVLERVVETFGDRVLETVIGRTVKFPDASVAGAPITSFAPDHSAADAYRQLARELISRGAVA